MPAFSGVSHSASLGRFVPHLIRCSLRNLSRVTECGVSARDRSHTQLRCRLLSNANFKKSTVWHVMGQCWYIGSECSGYHVCFTRRRSRVRASPEPRTLLLLSNYLIFFFRFTQHLNKTIINPMLVTWISLNPTFNPKGTIILCKNGNTSRVGDFHRLKLSILRTQTSRILLFAYNGLYVILCLFNEISVIHRREIKNLLLIKLLT